MSSVGGVTTDILKGETTALKERVITWFVPGIDGMGAMSLGRNQGSFQYIAVRYGSEGTVEAFLRSIDALQGTVVTIIDDHAQSRSNMLIVRVGVPQKVAEIGNGGYRGQVAISGKVVG